MQSAYVIRANKTPGGYTVYDPKDYKGHGPQALGFVQTDGNRFIAKDLCGHLISGHSTKSAAGNAVFQCWLAGNMKG